MFDDEKRINKRIKQLSYHTLVCCVPWCDSESVGSPQAVYNWFLLPIKGLHVFHS